MRRVVMSGDSGTLSGDMCISVSVFRDAQPFAMSQPRVVDTPIVTGVSISAPLLTEALFFACEAIDIHKEAYLARLDQGNDLCSGKLQACDTHISRAENGDKERVSLWLHKVVRLFVAHVCRPP